MAQRRCGIEDLKETIIAKHPEFKQQLEARKAELRIIAENYERAKRKGASATSSTDITIPVIFHIVVNQGQYDQLGGKWGIEQRCRSQIDVLNEDFNRQNPDSNLIPALWKPLYANVGIHFGLAHTDPYGYPSPGYTVRIISNGGISSYDSAKHANLDGTDSWDITKYANVWCLNFVDGNGLLGVTLPRSWADSTNLHEVGICILYNTLGRRNTAGDDYPKNALDGNYYDKGRTLTHEFGHFFEIWHVWGDDGGTCPWTGGNSVLPDLPPQGDHTFNNPRYTIPGGTINDNCNDSSGVNLQPIGIACLDYLDYTDDTGMHLFTPDQAAVMIAQVTIRQQVDTGESYSLTQHPELLQWPAGAPQSVYIFPNPTNGSIAIAFEDTANPLTHISIYNMFGAVVEQYTPGDETDHYTIDLSWLRDGVYIVKCQFQNGVITQKILLQTMKH